MYSLFLAAICCFCLFLEAMDHALCLHNGANGSQSLERMLNGKIGECRSYVESLSHVIDRIDAAQKPEKIDLLRTEVGKLTRPPQLQPCIKALKALAAADNKWHAWLNKEDNMEMVVEVLETEFYRFKKVPLN